MINNFGNKCKGERFGLKSTPVSNSSGNTGIVGQATQEKEESNGRFMLR